MLGSPLNMAPEILNGEDYNNKVSNRLFIIKYYILFKLIILFIIYLLINKIFIFLISKADIWSIGTVFYEILFGKPPFTAGNMIDLLKNIKTKPIEFNKNINNISPIAEDAIRRMLVKLIRFY
jgi:serine/threonine protein kinase